MQADDFLPFSFSFPDKKERKIIILIIIIKIIITDKTAVIVLFALPFCSETPYVFI